MAIENTLSIFDPSSLIVDNAFDCRLSGVKMTLDYNP